MSKTSKADPLSQHPAISAVRSVTGRYPSKAQYPSIIAILGDGPFNEEWLMACRQEWIDRAYNPMSIKWLEWYISGEIPNGGTTIGQTGGKSGTNFRQQRAESIINIYHDIERLKEELR